MSYRTFSILAIANAAAIALMYLAWAWPALAHEALPTAAKPNGWSYPFACCSGYDCREVGTSHKAGGTEGIRISEKPGGYEISSTRELIPYGDPRIKDSPDGAFHWCSVAGSAVGRTICLFVPPRAF